MRPGGHKRRRGLSPPEAPKKFHEMNAAERRAHTAVFFQKRAVVLAERAVLNRLGLLPRPYPYTGWRYWVEEKGPVGGFVRESVLERARRELKWMKDLDAQYEVLVSEGSGAVLPLAPGETAPAADAFRKLTNKSMAVFDKILSADVPMDESHVRLIREQREAASVTVRIGARVAIELYRAQGVGALAALIERMKTVDVSVDGEAPGDTGDDPEPQA